MRLLIPLLILLNCSAFAKPVKPNLMFILADDCTFRDLEVYGGQAKTPHLNALAEEGLKFNRCYQAAAMCSPTRHNLYTGIYPIHSGAYPNHTFANPGTKSIVHHLKAQGYRVALVGKTHINPESVFPFEYLDGMEHGYSDNKNTPAKEVVIRNPQLKQFIEECTESDTPFCLFAASYDPHGPYTRGNPDAYDPQQLVLPPNIFDTPKYRSDYHKYLAECTFFDQQVGECLSYLDEYKVKDNTLVMVATEQGSSFPFGKWNNYEHSLSSGLIVRWPGNVKPGTETEALVEYGDVVPTFVEAAGGKLVAPVDGKSFLAVLKGKKQHKNYSYGSQTMTGVNGNKEPYGMRTVVSERYRYIRNLKPERPITFHATNPFVPELNPKRSELAALALNGDVDAQAYINRMTHRPAEELYDIKKDPYCLVNLIDQPELKSVKQDLIKQLDAWMLAQGDQGWATELEAPERVTRTSALWKEIRSQK
ncbi:Choline-sulfatase [Pontiella sulfatireligans]|uniref:Choline-sulfatase n=1 Tax=Pontiella sulfatireligans TaxID=2750658 RepID=A0A6C2USA1_9BACT|nr:sulfatase S1_8 [Kiritimatiellales bacterium]VGO22131.1 Choline-sulfatase [Pontiella sulfatireligans]